MTRYYPHGGNLIDTFAHSMVAAIGWAAGRMLASMLGPWLLVLAVVLVVVYVARRIRRRRR